MGNCKGAITDRILVRRSARGYDKIAMIARFVRPFAAFVTPPQARRSKSFGRSA
jgi:hypothetical protein